MESNLSLLWTPQGWGVFDECSCPDTGAFPSHWYRKYSVPEEKYEIALGRLMDIQERLDIGKIVPARDMEKTIFPDISVLLSDNC
jgi:hypothetical protein